MSLLTLPLLAWGTPDDIGGAGYTLSGTISRTTGQADPFGGTSAVLLNDTDAAVFANARKSGIVLSTPGRQPLHFFIKPGTSGVSGVQLWDDTVGASRGQLNANVSGAAVTSVTAANGAQALGFVDLGGGWYLCLGLSATTVVPGNSHSYYTYPAISTAASTGTATFYHRHVILLDYLEQYTPKSRPRPGYERAKAPSGAADSWSYGNEYARELRLSFIPDAPRTSPTLVSGWFGQAESAGVNCGIMGLLAAGWDQQDLVFVPDRSACSTNWTGKMEKPGPDWDPADEPNEDRSVEIELVGTTAFTNY